jgi:uncharacterized protein DUF3551
MRTLILTAAVSVAALVAGPQAALAQNEGRYCLRSPTGALNCTYHSFKQCQQVRGGRSVGGGCVRNPGLATTGRGGTSRAARQPAPLGPPGGGQFLPSPTRSEALATTGRSGKSRAARQPAPLGPPGGGQFLPSPTRSEALATTGRSGKSRAARQPAPLGPPGGGQFLPSPTR